LVDYYGNTGKQNVTKTAKGRGNPVLFAVSVGIMIGVFKFEFSRKSTVLIKMLWALV